MVDPYLIDLQPGDTDETRDIVIQRWLKNISSLVSSSGVLTVAGTAGNVLVNGGTAAASGALTLSLPTALLSIDSVTAEAAHDLTLNAGSGTQNVVVQPSGTTGNFTVTNAQSAIHSVFSSAAVSSAPSVWLDLFTQSASANASRNWSFVTNNSIVGALEIMRSTAKGTGPSLSTAIFSNAGNLLLGGLTTDGTGGLQFPVSTTSAGGIAFGTTNFIYAGAANQINVDVGATNPLIFDKNGTLSRIFNTGRLILQSNDATTGASRGLIFNNQGNDIASLDSTGFTVISTNLLKFGGTANANIGVSANTTAGNLVFTGTTTGNFTFNSPAAASQWVFNHVGGTNPTIQLQEGAVGTAQFLTSSGTLQLKSTSGSLTLYSNNTLGFTLDTSQNATFAGTISGGNSHDTTITSGTGADIIINAQSGRSNLVKVGGTQIFSLTNAAGVSTLTGAAGNMTITAGTGNSRTLTLQTTTSGGTATNAIVANATQDISIATGNLTVDTVGKTISIKSGANAKAGTFTLSSGAATVSNTSVTANSVINFTIKTVSGTIGVAPQITATVVGTSFTVTGAATNNSIYNYVIEEVN